MITRRSEAVTRLDQLQLSQYHLVGYLYCRAIPEQVILLTTSKLYSIEPITSCLQLLSSWNGEFPPTDGIYKPKGVNVVWGTYWAARRQGGGLRCGGQRLGRGLLGIIGGREISYTITAGMNEAVEGVTRELVSVAQ
jgi:hypothetical protein